MVTDNFRCAILMVVSMALFAVEDTFIKLLANELPYAQVLAMVGVLGCVTFALILKIKRRRIWTRDLLRPTLLFRNLAEALGSVCFVIALALTDLSSTSAIFQALPLAILLGAAVFLREPVGWRRWAAILVGFAGVLLVIRPGLDGFRPVSLFALLAVVLMAARDLVTRRVPAQIHSDQLAASAFGAIAVASVILALLLGQAFVMPSLWQCAALLGCLIMGVVAYSALVIATRQGDAAAIAPFRYARLVFAMILGFLVFDERPDGLTLIGAGIIVASGCYMMWREALLRRRQMAAAGLATV